MCEAAKVKLHLQSVNDATESLLLDDLTPTASSLVFGLLPSFLSVCEL